jgi:hypothetical protein
LGLPVIEVFDLQVDSKRRRRDDEIWLKSPFTGEATASMHVSLSQNIFKDFRSGRCSLRTQVLPHASFKHSISGETLALLALPFRPVYT